MFSPHMTVATILHKEGHFLCVEEYISNNQRAINQPAGHVEDGESLVSAAIRETLEETAWECNITGVVSISRWRKPDNAETFFRVTFAGEPVQHFPEQKLDDGIIQTLWLTRDEIANCHESHRSPMVLKCIDDYLAHPPFSLDIICDI